MDFAFLVVGMAVGFVFGCLFTVWWYAPSEVDRGP